MRFEASLMTYLDSYYKETLADIRSKRMISEASEAKLIEAIGKQKAIFRSK